MRRKINVKKIVLIFLLLAGLGSIGFEILGRVYQAKAAHYFRAQFNQQSDLVLSPFTTSFSIWKHFPRATFTFQNISLTDTSGTTPLPVLTVKRAEVVIPLAQFRLRKIRIARLNLEDLTFQQRIDRNGNKNGLRFRPVIKPDTAAGKLLFKIDNLAIKKARFISENLYKKTALALQINQTELAVERKEQHLNINGKLQGKINYYATNRRRLYQNQSFSANAHYVYQLATKQGFFNQTQAMVNGNLIEIKGSHTRLPTNDGNQLDLTVAGHQPILHMFRQIMPPTALPALARLKSNSRVYLVCRFKGATGPRLRPRSTIQFRLTNGKLYIAGTKNVITDVTLAGMLDNGSKHLPETSQLTLSNIRARFGKGFVQMQVDLKNFTRPTFAIQGNGQLDLPILAQVFSLPLAKASQGMLSGNLKINGVLPDSLRGSTPDLRGQGLIQLQNAAFQPAGFSVMWRNVNGKFKFSDKDLQLQKLGGLIAGQPFNLSASIQNYLPYLFGQPGRLKVQVDFEAKALHSAWLQGKLYAAHGPSSVPKSASASFAEEESGMYRLVRTAQKPAPPKKNLAAKSSSEQQVNRVLQSLLQAASSQLKVRVGTLNLSGNETINRLQFQVNQRGQRVTLTNMRFTSAQGGKATATGGFRLTNTGIQAPYLNANLYYDFLNLQTFMQQIANLRELAPPSNRPLSKSQRQRRAAFRENNYWLQLKVNAQRVQYEYLNGSNLLLHANLNKNRAKLQQLSLQAFGGQINSHGNMRLDNPDKTYSMRLQAKVSGIDLQQLFTVANQMEMDVLSSQNIKGKVECNVAVLTQLDQTFSPTLDKTIAYANATFRDMELIEVTPIQNALRFLRKERTRHLYFDDVTTRFVMQNNQFITPKLRMNSNLTDFELSGKYVMRGGANLNMDINVLNVLFGNNKRRIEKIQSADSVANENNSNKQHLLLIREQDKYKVKLTNKKDRAASNKALKEEFNYILQQHQIDTLFTLNR